MYLFSETNQNIIHSFLSIFVRYFFVFCQKHFFYSVTSVQLPIHRQRITTHLMQQYIAIFIKYFFCINNIASLYLLHSKQMCSTTKNISHYKHKGKIQGAKASKNKWNITKDI